MVANRYLTNAVKTIRGLIHFSKLSVWLLVYLPLRYSGQTVLPVLSVSCVTCPIPLLISFHFIRITVFSERLKSLWFSLKTVLRPLVISPFRSKILIICSWTSPVHIIVRVRDNCYTRKTISSFYDCDWRDTKCTEHWLVWTGNTGNHPTLCCM